MGENSEGKCKKCGQALTKRRMEKHVLECFQRKACCTHLPWIEKKETRK